jgi:hypothetical protein
MSSGGGMTVGEFAVILARNGIEFSERERQSQFHGRRRAKSDPCQLLLFGVPR